METSPGPIPLLGGNGGGREGAAGFSTSKGDAKAQHPLTRLRKRVPPSLPVGGVPVLRVSQLSRAAPCPGQQTKSGYTGARPAPALWQGREVNHCPHAPQPQHQTRGGCQVGHSRAGSGCTMARLVGPAAALLLLCLAVGLEASPELSGESGRGQDDKGCWGPHQCEGGRSDSRVGGVGTNEAQTGVGQSEFAKKKRVF